MPNPATIRKQRLRKTKAQLVDELETIERRIAGPGGGGTLLTDAIESIPEGFSYYDADDRLVLCNKAHKDIFGYSDTEAVPGASYVDLIRLDVARGIVVHNEAGGDGYLRRRKKNRRQAAGAFEMQLADGRWIQIRDCRTASGGLVSIQSDVTGLKRAEKALRESERRYETITANIPGVVYERVLHPDGGISFPYVSAGLREIHGLDPEEVMRDPAAWRATTHPDDRERLEKSNAESIEKLEDWNLEYRIVARDGTTKWLRGRSHVRRDATGDVVWDGVLLDITKEHLSQQRISDLAKFPSENPNPIIRVKPDGKVLYANDAARAVDGLVVGGKRSTLTRKLSKALDAGLHGGKGQEQELTSGDRIFAFVFTPVPGKSYINVYGRDVTKEHCANQELVTARETSAAAEALLRDAIDNISDGFVVYDSNRRLVTCNQKWKNIYGYSDEDAAPGVKYEDLVRLDLAKGVIADQSGQAEAYYKHRLAYRKEKEGAFEVELADGRWILIRERRTSSGGRVGIQADITERKRAEEALRDSRELLHAVTDAVPAMISAKDRDSRYLFVNRYQAELYGVSRDEAIGKTAGNLLGRKYGAHTKRLDRKVIESGEALPYFEEDHTDARGARRELLATKVPLKDRHDRVQGVVTVALDITERKRAEDELRKSREQLQALADNLPEFISMKDPDRRFVFVNRRFEEWVCVDRNDVIGKSVHDIYPEEQAVEFDALDREVLASRKVMTREVNLSYPDGDTRTIISIRFPVISSKGEVLGLGTLNHDITELKRTEQDLAEKEAQLRAALDNMPGGMMLGDRDLNYVLFNSQYIELHDYPEGFLKVGITLREEARFQVERGDFGPGDKDELVEQLLDRYQRGKATSWERTFPDGRTLRFNMAPTPEGGNATILTDITERKRTEEALRLSEQRHSMVTMAMTEGLYDWNITKDTLYVSPWLREIFGFEEGELTSKDWLARVHADDGENYRLALVRYFKQETSVLECEYRIRYTVGGDHWVSDRAIAQRDDRGRAVRLIGAISDITERKRAEEALLEAKRRAEEASKLVAEKNRMLESLSNQLSKYLSPQVYSSIFSGEQSVEIASKRKKLTVFFSDIADFTGTTDSLESEELTNLLNHYLTEMSKIALDYGATIDKYVGDAIIAFFGDPETRGVKEDARTCVNMAIAMQRRMQELQSEWLDMGLERPFQLRIGINTGFCTVGNFGSGDRMDYTIIGNEVNLAARLESHAEVGGILLAHETHSLVKDTVLAEEGDTLTVKGFAKPVRTYSVVGLYDDLAEQGKIIHTEQGAVRILVDLKKGGKADAIQAIKDVLSQLEG